MAQLAAPVSVRDVSFTLSDATGTPISTTIQFEEGDLSIDGFQEGNAPLQYFYDRHTIYAARKGPDEVLSFSFSCDANQITHATEALAIDAANKSGAFAAGVSTWGANADDPWTVKCVITIERTDSGGAADETYTFDYVRLKASWAEGDRAQWSFSGEIVPKNGTGVTRA